MKFVKLSLATIVALSTSAFGADTLADAFKEAKVSGQIQAQYWDRDHGPDKDADMTAFGLDLSYETATFNGFGLKATFQSSAAPFIDETAKDVFKGDQYGEGASVSEAYISYAFDNTAMKAGRMYFATPLIYGSGSRINKEAFEGALITNTDIPNTKVTLGYVQKMQNRTSFELDSKGKPVYTGDFGKFSKNNLGTWQGNLKDGAYTIVVNNSSIENLNLTLAYLDAEDLMKVSYTEASYKFGNYGLAAQYYYSDYETASDTTDLLGLKATAQFDKLGLVAAYVTTGDSYVYAGLGNGADYSFAWSNVLGDNYTAETDSYKIGANYQVTPSLNLGVNYVLEDKPAKDISITGVSASYNFTGALKGLSANLMYDQEGEDGDREELRLNVAYSF